MNGGPRWPASEADMPIPALFAAVAPGGPALGPHRTPLDPVAALPAPRRAAVVLCELDGLPRAEAASRLGVPEGTLSSRLAKARKVLASRLLARGGLPTAAGLAVLFDRAAGGAAVGPELAGV